MIFKKGDIYRNKISNVACFLKDVKGDNVLITWTWKSKNPYGQWQQPRPNWEHVIENTNGYIEYTVTKPANLLLKEITEGLLSTESYGNEDNLILNWIPQHTFLAT